MSSWLRYENVNNVHATIPIHGLVTQGRVGKVTTRNVECEAKISFLSAVWGRSG